MSFAILPSAPQSTPTWQASVAVSSRCVCHAPAGSASERSAAMRAATAAPCSPITASVPTAPPSCNCKADAAASRRRCRQRSSGAVHATSLKPRLTTCAGCIKVRASTGVRACCCASASKASIRRPRSRSISASARRDSRPIAVSITSWLVLPQCTQPAASASITATRSVSWRSNGIARLPARPLAATMAGTSKSSRLQASAMVSAAAAGIMPSAACARASAASKSSMAWTRLVSLNTASTSGVDRKLSNTNADMCLPRMPARQAAAVMLTPPPRHHRR